MTDERDNEEQIFHTAITKPVSERSDYVREACGNRPELISRIENLLRAYDAGDDFMESPPWGGGIILDRSFRPETPGTVIGRYKLLEKIGEGGMAAVYMAEQAEPIRRKVALKIIKLGMDTKAIIARFEAERQALAMMDHPNIAKVLDAGATDSGRPYFVMELVTGVSVVEYCDTNKLSTRERLDLFILVCNAVHHAHQKGIIHRDIKPSNVMVTLHDGKPVPKVIDFGIAKATNQKLTEKTLFTRYARLIGTPAYMSPEQAEMSSLDIDTRADIYSLGVLLYELLTSTTPFDPERLREAGYAEMQRIIQNEEPDKPSKRLSTLGGTLTKVAELRRIQPGDLCRTIRGDLDWVVMKTLEKNRNRRYESASELAMDIERHLGDEPVLAGPPSAGYRLHKFVRRHRLAVAASLLIACALLTVVVISVMYAHQAEEARQDEIQAGKEISGLLAASYVDRAQALCEQGEIGRGMLWLTHSLEAAPEGSGDLDRAVRMSLAAWYGRLHSLRTMVRYPGRINSVKFSPDGSQILAACQDGTVRFCDALTGRQSREPLRPGDDVRTVAISPDGTRIAAGGSDGTTRLWDTVTLEPVGEPMPNGGEGSPIMVFSPDSSRIATGTTGGAVWLWEASTGKSLGKIFQYEGEGKLSVRAIAFCRDGLRAVLTIALGTHQMFDIEHREPVGPSVMAPDTKRVAISPDGTRFVTAGYGSRIRVWDATTGKLTFEPIVQGAVVSALAISPDGSRITAGGNTRMGLLWDAATGEPIGAPMRQRNTVTATAFSPDGKRIATGNADGVVRIWDLAEGRHTGRPVRHDDRVLGAAFGPHGLRILTETNDMIRVRSAVTGEPIGRPFAHSGQIHPIAFSSDGSRLVTQRASYSRLQLWDVATGMSIGEPFHNFAHDIAFSPDGSRILTGGQDRVARLWDAATLELLGEFRQHKDTVRGVAFSPDGSKFLTGSFDGTTQLWDAVTLEPVGKPLIHQSEVKDLAFSPDSTKILIGFADGTVRLFDTATLKPIGTPLQHAKVVCAVDFSPNGSQFMACSMEKTARIWDSATLKPIGPPLEHDGWWPRASFSPDGSQILVADFEGAARIWDVPTGPLQGNCERIICWVQMVTGLELDPNGGINVLDAATWQQRRQRLQELGGPPEMSLPARSGRMQENL